MIKNKNSKEPKETLLKHYLKKLKHFFWKVKATIAFFYFIKTRKYGGLKNTLKYKLKNLYLRLKNWLKSLNKKK